MKHLIISRELPPATYPAGGIGTYVATIARLLAESGETVHLIAERWRGAPQVRETLHEGRLIIHRIGAGDVPEVAGENAERLRRELQGLKRTDFPQQWFAWSAGLLAERLVEEEGVEVIEAQEWEAPLYYFLLRRELGLGPQRRPPCIVHLHSPSVFIHHFNGPPVTPARLRPMTRMEAFCIQSADALLCPSRGLAQDAARQFRLPPGAVEVIPLPMGFSAPLVRDPSVWAEGSICYVGRLEPRKGIIEWVEAASRVAREDPRVSFDFVGANVWNLERPLKAQIGAALAPRFRFHGAKSKAEIATYLARAKAAVVPSRWENFPNVCIEAMASGLPVIATPYGGLSEMVEDGRTGWLAADLGVAGLADSLADALRACLATPSGQLAAMGAAAAETIRRICDNDAVLAAHKRFRAAAAERGARPPMPNTAQTRPTAKVVVRVDALAAAEGVLRSLEAQTMKADAVAVVCQTGGEAGWTKALRLKELRIEHAPTLVGAEAWNQGVAVLGAADFWLFLDQYDRLEPGCLERMAAVFCARPDVGLVSPWTDRTGQGRALDVRPPASLRDQLTGNEVAPASGFRAQALGAERWFRPGLPREYDVWALANAVIARGWKAAPLPALLARRETPKRSASWIRATALRAMRAEALAPFDTDANRLALQLVDAYVPPPPRWGETTAGERVRRLVRGGLELAALGPRQALERLVARATARP